MCGLCSADPKEVEAEKKKLERVADRLQDLASRYNDMRYGRTDPHGKNAITIGIIAKSVIRDLVEEWL